MSEMPELNMTALKASKYWVKHLEPEKQEKRLARYREVYAEVAEELVGNARLLGLLDALINMRELMGRTEGHREGWNLREFATQLENRKEHDEDGIDRWLDDLMRHGDQNLDVAYLERIRDGVKGRLQPYRAGRVSLTVMKYVFFNSHDPSKLIASEICKHLDKQCDRLRQQKLGQRPYDPTLRVSLSPPKAWATDTWETALRRKRNVVDQFFWTAKKNALGGEYLMLCALAAGWGWRDVTSVEDDEEQVDLGANEA